MTPPSRATVERHVAALDQRRIVRLRERPTAASEQFTIRSGMIEVLRPLQIVQIDHTLVDVFVVDEETRVPAGRPYLTLAIDVLSRMVVGFHLTMDYPSVLSVGLCLTQAVFDRLEGCRSKCSVRWQAEANTDEAQLRKAIAMLEVADVHRSI